MNKFEYKRLCPFKWYVLQNFPFIEADFDAITNYQLYCKVVEYLNKILDNVNIIGNQMEEVTNAFIELQNYVNSFFDNLDLQEEVNNKLDEMAQNGTLNSVLNNFLTYKLYTVNLSRTTEIGSFNLVVFPNGFTILFDCGYTGQENAIQNFMTEKNISHLDVVIVSHFHADHSGCFEFIARNYCDENTLFFRQMTCDYSRLTGEGLNGASAQQEQNYTNVLTELGYLNNSRIPTQNEIVSLSNGMVKLRFLNTDNEFANSYYSTFSDTNEQNYEKSSLNNFSLICELSAFNKKLLFTGDVETQGQINNESFMQKCDIMQIPHHNWNHNGYYKFFDRISPEITFFNRNTQLTDRFVYWSKYQRQRVGYKPTYYTYNSNVEIDISNVGINVLEGTIDNTFDIPNGSQQLVAFLPFCTNYTVPYFSYRLWSIKDVINMIKDCDNKVYTVLVATGGRYDKFNQEIQAMTNVSTNWILNTNHRGFEIQRLSNWDGIIYKFINDFDFDNTDTYINYFGAYLSPFNNKSVNENLNLAEDQNATLQNQVRFAPTLETTIRTFIGEDETNYIDYNIILKHKGSGNYYGEDTAFTYDENSQKTFLRNARLQVRITNNVLYVDVCKSIVYNATDNQTTVRRGILLKLNSTTLI